jgi:O-6-methylguanine DNA methyltransferase
MTAASTIIKKETRPRSNDSLPKSSQAQGEPLFYDTIRSPLGDLTICVDGNCVVYGLEFSAKVERINAHMPVRDKAKCARAARELEEYLAGTRSSFDLKLGFLHATLFQQKVWAALLEIPYGQTRSYKDIAERIKSPRACRAVGNAAGANPIPILIPCHRLVASHGKIGGYSGGIEKKVYLLGIEKRNRRLSI